MSFVHMLNNSHGDRGGNSFSKIVDGEQLEHFRYHFKVSNIDLALLASSTNRGVLIFSLNLHVMYNMRVQ